MEVQKQKEETLQENIHKWQKEIKKLKAKKRTA